MISRSSRRQKFRILKLNFTLGCYKSRKNGNFMLLPQKLGSKNFGFRSFKRFYPTSSSYLENFLVLNITTEIMELSNPITNVARLGHVIIILDHFNMIEHSIRGRISPILHVIMRCELDHFLSYQMVKNTQYTGLLKMGTHMCNKFRWKSLFFGQDLFGENAKVPIFKQKNESLF